MLSNGGQTHGVCHMQRDKGHDRDMHTQLRDSLHVEEGVAESFLEDLKTYKSDKDT